MADDQARGFRLRLSPWALVFTGSLVVLAAAAAALGVLWLTSVKTTDVSLRLPASLVGIELRVQSGDVTVVGGSQSGVLITTSNRSVFGHSPREHRSLSAGIVQISSTCPRLVLGSCAANFRIDVPDNVPISVRAENGSVRLEGYHGSADIATNRGAITVERYCGFVLGAASASGNVTVSSACSPEQLTLRSGSGNVSAVVPSGNYRIQAASNTGAESVKGLLNDDGAPWAIQALSNSGAVRVAAQS